MQFAVVVFEEENEENQGGPKEVAKLLGPFRSFDLAEAAAGLQTDAWVMVLERP